MAKCDLQNSKYYLINIKASARTMLLQIFVKYYRDILGRNPVMSCSDVYIAAFGGNECLLLSSDGFRGWISAGGDCRGFQSGTVRIINV